MDMDIEQLQSCAAEAAALMKSLSNPWRLMVLCELSKGERSVGALEQVLGLPQSPLSQHLAKLRRDGLVKTRRNAQTIYYSLAAPRVTKIIGLLHDLYCSPDAPAAS